MSILEDIKLKHEAEIRAINERWERHVKELEAKLDAAVERWKTAAKQLGVMSDETENSGV